MTRSRQSTGDAGMPACRRDPARPERVHPPGPAGIERRFRSPAVVILRPVILGGIGVLGLVRGFGWAAESEAALDEIEGPLIFAANHCSHADTAAILGTLPKARQRRTCVAAALDVFGPAPDGRRHSLHALKRECLQIIVAAGFHAFAFDRHGPPLGSLRTAVALVRSGWSLLLYPEGTRSRTGALGRFKSGVGVIAKMTGRPVIPVHVAGGTTILPCNRTLPGRGHALVRYGAPMHHQGGESAAEFTARLRDRIRRLAPEAEESTAAALPEITTIPRQPPAVASADRESTVLARNLCRRGCDTDS